MKMFEPAMKGKPSISEPKSARIGIIGLGIMGGIMGGTMGGTMTRALLAAGHQVPGYDIDDASLRALRRAGGKPMPGYAEVASRPMH